VWPLIADNDNQLRVVIVNKRASEAANVTLTVPKVGGWGNAQVSRMVAEGPSPLDAQTGISVGGIYFDADSNMQGKKVSEVVNRVYSNYKLNWSIYMPPASAALVTIPRQTSGAAARGGGAAVAK
jgi:hypothetical protein